MRNLLLILILLSPSLGCVRHVARERVAVGSESEGALARESALPRHREEIPPLPPAARDLLEGAEAARRAGELEAALSLAERAQRIAPQAPEVYLALGRLNLEAGAPARAEQLARKAAQLAGASEALGREARALIQEARAAR